MRTNGDFCRHLLTNQNSRVGRTPPWSFGCCGGRDGRRGNPAWRFPPGDVPGLRRHVKWRRSRNIVPSFFYQAFDIVSLFAPVNWTLAPHAEPVEAWAGERICGRRRYSSRYHAGCGARDGRRPGWKDCLAAPRWVSDARAPTAPSRPRLRLKSRGLSNLAPILHSYPVRRGNVQVIPHFA